jgi:hypothetical protein
MYHFYDTVINDKTGVPLPGVVIRVTDYFGATVSLFADNGGTPIDVVSGIPNAAVTDNSGMFDFYVDAGVYNLYFYVGDALLKVLRDIWCGIGGGGSGGNTIKVEDVATAGQTDIPLPTEPLVDPYVYIDGVLIPSDKYSISGPLLTLVDPMANGTEYVVLIGFGVEEQFVALPNVVGLESELSTRPTQTMLAAYNGSSLSGWRLPATGAVDRTVYDRFADTIHAKDFGVVADGSADDAPALNLAAAHMALRGGGRLLVPEGQMLCNSTVVFFGGGVVIEGEGSQASWFVNGTNNAACIQIGDGTNHINRCSVRNVLFGQKSGLAASGANCAIKAVNCSSLSLDNIDIFEYPNKLQNGIILEDCDDTHIGSVRAQSVFQDGLSLTRCLDTYAVASRFNTSTNGVKFTDAPGVYFTGVACYGNTGSAFLLAEGPLVDNVYHFYNNCIGDTSGYHNWEVRQCSIGVWAGCWGSTQIYTGAHTDACGWWLSGGSVSDISLTGCVGITNNAHGLNIDLAAKVYVSNCIFGSSYKAGAGNGKSGAGSGILIGQYCNRVRIIGGGCENNASYGIDVALGADRGEVFGVELRSNVLANVRNLANATEAKVKFSGCGGYNPVGSAVAQPSFPASGVAVTNLSGVDCTVYIEGGTVSNIKVNDFGVFAGTGKSIFLPFGANIAIDYTVSPAWQWYGH